MQNESAHATNVTSLDRRRPGAAFNRTPEAPVRLEPELVLLPDMSHTNGRGVVELIASVLRQ